MNLDIANLLLTALLERLSADASSDKPQYGAVVSSADRLALQLVLETLGRQAVDQPETTARAADNLKPAETLLPPNQTTAQEGAKSEDEPCASEADFAIDLAALVYCPRDL